MIPDHLDLAELEQRLRPGQASTLGFLGPNESLTEILEQDAQTLQAHGLTHPEVAAALELILAEVLEQRQRHLFSDNRLVNKELGFPNLYQPETNPVFSRSNLPDPELGWRVGKLQVFIHEYRGLQECPWGCGPETWGSFDFLILNRENGEAFTGPQMLPHLIRAHHFFEGRGTPFRSDPEKIIRTLELDQR